MATITLNGSTVTGIIPGEPWEIRLQPIIDGALPANGADVRIAFLSKDNTDIAQTATKVIVPAGNNGTYVLAWNAALTFSGSTVTGGWEGIVPADDTGQLLSVPTNKQSSIPLTKQNVYLYTFVDGATVKDAYKLSILRGVEV